MRPPVPARRNAFARIASLLAIGLAAAGCARPAAVSPAGAPPARSVLLFPLNVVVPMPTGLESGAASVSEALHAYLEAHANRVETLDPAAARAAWLAAAQELKAELGETQMSFDGAARVLARTLHRERRFDALVLPWLVLRPAKVHGRTVTWDGVTRTLRVVGGDQRTHFLLADFEAQAAAPSLQVAVFAADGGKLSEAVGGLDLIHLMLIVGDPPQIDAQVLPSSQILADHANVSEGIALALDPFLAKPQP
jgi:hypothetical protein